MYCEKCGQETEPSEICPKCGCLSGYVDVQKISNQQREKVKNLPVKIISFVGIALLVLSLFFNDLPLLMAVPSRYFTYPLVDIAGIAAFISLMVRKFEKTKLLYLIICIIDEVYSIVINPVISLPTIVFIISLIVAIIYI